MKNLILLTFILAGLNAFADAGNLGEKIEPKEPSAQNKPSGLYRIVSKLCSDGSVYKFDAGAHVITSSSTDGFEITMDFLSDSRVKTSIVINSFTNSVTHDYSLNNNELTIYRRDTRGNARPMLSNTSIMKFSVNPSQLILSFPGFSDFGGCTRPAYLITIYEKVN